ncbi:MAG TPA: YqaJ viral recombinase family protein [Aquabacterium sp.]|nr:YqaJ viral recombinase family protein [Aquabacterium sp.]
MITIINCAQNSPEWFAARLGIPTASEFANLMREKADAKTRRSYLMRLAGERLTGKPMVRYTNADIERGHEQEPEARALYAMLTDTDPVQVGFIRNDAVRAGASPDSLIGADGMLEIKTRAPHVHIEQLLDGEVPSEHKAQLQGQLWIAEREWVDFLAYSPGLKPFLKRVYRDEPYIERLAKAVQIFNAELNLIVQQVAA